MYKYFNEIVICSQLNKENECLKKEVDKLKKQNRDLEYKYEGLLECKTDIYKKYQDLIIKNTENNTENPEK